MLVGKTHQSSFFTTLCCVSEQFEGVWREGRRDDERAEEGGRVLPHRGRARQLGRREEVHLP